MSELGVRSQCVNVPLAGVPEDAGRVDTLERDVWLIIDRIEGGSQDRGEFQFTGGGELFTKKFFRGISSLSPNDVLGLSQNCRREWQKALVNFARVERRPEGGQANTFPFQERLPRPAARRELRAIGARLAVEGQKLFSNVFGQDPGMQEIGNVLQAASADRQLVITFNSAEFFVPWNLIYTHPSRTKALALDGSNFRWRGFWGARHILEHSPLEYALETRLHPGAEGLATGINVDEKIDEDGIPCIAPQLAFFEKMARLDRRVRRKKLDLATALTTVPFSDQIFYFCCHGEGAGDPDHPNVKESALALTDQERITVYDINGWLKQRTLESNPVVFINACQGGQMNTLFYRTVARELLKRRARAVVGAQVDVPVVFAAAYATAFFDRFLASAEPMCLGEVIRWLAREFLVRDRNPLGLVYSLYRGADCRVEWPKA